MLGGYFESLAAVIIHEVLNTIVSYRIVLCGTGQYCLCTYAWNLVAICC